MEREREREREREMEKWSVRGQSAAIVVSRINLDSVNANGKKGDQKRKNERLENKQENDFRRQNE